MDGKRRRLVANKFSKACVRTVVGVLLLVGRASGQDASFTNLLVQAQAAEQRGDLAAAAKNYSEAESLASNQAPNLCILSRRYCDLMYLTNSAPVKKAMLDRGLECAQLAVRAAPDSATAHASLAVCYAQRCAFSDVKGQLADSRLFKLEAEKVLALDPRQDIAYYLLARWNYAVANVGWLSRTYVKVIYGGLPKASNAEAIRNFRKAIELAPQRIIHHAGLAMVYAQMGDKKSEIAELEKCRSLKATDREDADAQREAVEKLAELGR